MVTESGLKRSNAFYRWKEKSGHIMKKKKILVFIVFVCLFFYGISNTFEYGRPWDESDELSILLSNVKEYGDNPQIQKIVHSTWIEYLGVSPISESTEKDHGIAGYYGFIPFFYHIGYDTRPLMYAWHYFTFVLWFTGVLAVYGILKELYRGFVPIVGTGFFFFTPRIFADGHYNNKDIAFLVFVIIVLFFSIRAVKYDRRRDYCLFSFFSGFLMNAKILGIAIWGLICLFVLAYGMLHKKNSPEHVVSRIVSAGLLAVLCYFLLTPAMWKNPIAFFNYCIDNATHFSRWGGTFLFNGKVLDPARNGIPYVYLPVWMLMTTPAYISLLFFTACCVLLVRIIKTRGKCILQDKNFFGCLFLLLFCFPFFHVVLHARSTVLYNAWRHCYFLYAPVFLLSMYVIDDAAGLLHNKQSRKNLALAGLILTISCSNFIVTVSDMIQNRSFEYVYFNRITRKILNPSDFDGDYWNVSILPALIRFADEYYDGENQLKVAYMSVYGGGQRWSFEEMKYDDGRLEIVPEEEADYFLFNASTLTNRKVLEEYEVVSSIRCFDNDLAGIYIKKSSDA